MKNFNELMSKITILHVEKINTKFLGIFELEHQQAVIHMLLSVVQTLDSKNSDVDHEPAKFL